MRRGWLGSLARVAAADASAPFWFKGATPRCAEADAAQRQRVDALAFVAVNDPTLATFLKRVRDFYPAFARSRRVPHCE